MSNIYRRSRRHHTIYHNHQPQEVHRLLEALQTNGLCACDWQKGDKTL